jgi:integrase
LRPATYETLFGLIASAGLRVSEALDLLDADVDLTLGVITIRQSKFAKSRQLPLHPTTVDALQRYRRKRNRYFKPCHPMPPFFTSLQGEQLRSSQVHRVFAQLREQLGWVNRGAHHAPRIHDLRHAFAVRRMMRWHQQGTDIDQAILALSTYLGHVKISSTYWYLTAVPELMALAAEKFERFAHSIQEVDHV